MFYLGFAAGVALLSWCAARTAPCLTAYREERSDEWCADSVRADEAVRSAYRTLRRTCSTLRALSTTPHTFRRALDEELTHAARRRAVAKLKALFSGGHMFYDRLNGVMPLTPGEQKAVGRILTACGAAEPVEFDAYTELFDFSLRLSYE